MHSDGARASKSGRIPRRTACLFYSFITPGGYRVSSRRRRLVTSTATQKVSFFFLSLHIECLSTKFFSELCLSQCVCERIPPKIRQEATKKALAKG